ncbi:MAG: type II secretion system F family protein [Candidatus Methanoperedens sp.]|jgi:flagellar protein FlaJ|nr:type II secretion system F family protein [Candidatus Methanoperedens sp.]
MPITARRYYARAKTLPLVSAFAGLLLGYSLIYLFIGDFMEIKPGIPGEKEILAYVFIPLLFAAFAYVLAGQALLYYPQLIASTRKKHIDLTIQHSATYLYAMSKGGLNLYESLTSLGKNASIYGEAAVELGRIERDMKLFGKSSLEAMQSLIETTPSSKMQEFLRGLVSVTNSKGDIAEYFRRKSQQYHAEAQNEQKLFLETLGVISEGYVVALVAGPMFLIVVGIVMGMIGSGFTSMLYAVVYGFIPVASVAFLVFISTLSKTASGKADLFIHKKEPSPFKDIPVIAGDAKKADTLRQEIQKKRSLIWLKDPVKLFYLHPEKALYMGLFIGALYFIYHLWQAGFELLEVDRDLLFATLIAMLPFAVFYEAGSYRINHIENQMPGFLRKLANASDAGLTLVKAIEMTLFSESGALAAEVKKVLREAKWGSPISASLIRMSRRVRTIAMTRIVSLIVKASEASGNIAEVMNIAADEAESEKKLKQARLAVTSVYLIIIYMAFFCFLFIAVILSRSFLPALSQGSIPGMGSGMGSGMGAGEIKQLMFHAALLNGFFSGLVAGEITEGSIASGVKHSIIMLLAAYITFIFAVGLV